MSSGDASHNRFANLGEVVIAGEVRTAKSGGRETRNIILLLAGSVALMMTGLGIIMPVFARRLGELGEGVEALGFMTMAYALTQFLVAPYMGSLADRLGRRPLILLALAAFIFINIGYLLATSMIAFILIRAVGGALTAGLFPASMGIVADRVPEAERARWVGIVMGGYGAGLIFGPVIGGLLYDTWGFAGPFLISAGLAALALVAAIFLVPETRPKAVRRRVRLRQRREVATRPSQSESIWDSLPRPLSIFGTILFIDFIGTFAFTFIEPQMVFYVYEELDWTTVQFGLVVGAYGLSMVLGQTLLGQTSDKIGRKPVILIGILLNTSLYAGVAFVQSFSVMLVVSAIAGLGNALLAPALSAFFLDITTDAHRARVVGIKESALALGGVLGPLLVAFASNYLAPQTIFIIGGGLLLFGALLALILLREPSRLPQTPEGLRWETQNQRAMAAQAALRGIVMRATTARDA